MPSLFRHRSKRGLDRTETFHSDSTTMSMSTSSISSGSSRPTSRNYDTGFPEWFAAHTTSLRHPDAITTPGACISAEDLDPSKALRRGKRSLMAKHKRTLSHGKIPPEPNQNQQHPMKSSVVDPAHETGGEGLAHGKFESQSPTTTEGSGSEVVDWDPDVPIDSTEHSDDDAKSRRNSNNPFKRWRSHHH